MKLKDAIQNPNRALGRFVWNGAVNELGYIGACAFFGYMGGRQIWRERKRLASALVAALHSTTMFQSAPTVGQK